jgi:dihydroorotate dehydrogenase (NAD+) catalytic subunit
MGKAKAFYDPAKTYDDNFDNGPFPLSQNEQPYQQTGEPQFTFLSFPVYSPFGIPAGPLLNSKYVRYAFEHGFDVVCYKTQRSATFPCNPFPNILYLNIDGDLTLERTTQPIVGYSKTNRSPQEFSITNSFAVPSRGPDFWVPDMQRAAGYAGKGQLMIAAVQGTIQEGFGAEEYYDDFAAAARLAVQAKPKAIEINLSCPNVATEGVLCYRSGAVIDICRRVKDAIGDTPLIIKLGYFTADQEQLLETILKGTAPYVAAISAINTLTAPIVNEKGEQALPGPNRLKSGICGASIKWAGLDMVARLNQLRKRYGLHYEIVGVGGVMSADDVHKYRNAGANLVQSATGAMWNPGLAAEVKANL